MKHFAITAVIVLVVMFLVYHVAPLKSIVVGA